MLLAIVVSSLVPSDRAAAQFAQPNEICGDILLTSSASDPAGLLSILAAEGFSSGSVGANSLPSPPMFTASTAASPLTPTLAEYIVTVEAGGGVAYSVGVTMRLDSGSDTYNFVSQVSDLVFPDPADNVKLDFEECVALLDVTWRDGNGDPVSMGGGRILSHLPSASTDWQARSVLTPGTSQEYLAVRAGSGEHRVEIEYDIVFGSDPFSDLVHVTFLCNDEEQLVDVDCGDLVPIECVVPDIGSDGPLALGKIEGEIDMLGEDEHPIAAEDYTLIRAFEGPFDNQRLDTLPVDPSEGPFLLENLLPSDFVSPEQGYRVQGTMTFREGRRYQWFRTPRLGGGNPPVSVGPNQCVDLGSTFVMDPGTISGPIVLVGPPPGPFGACLEDVYFDADEDADSDGIPDTPNGILLGQGSNVLAQGLSATADGADLTTVGGLARVGYDGGFDATTDGFVGDYELVLGGLRQEPSRWLAQDLTVVFRDDATPGQPETWQRGGATIENQMILAQDVIPGQDIQVPHRYCFGQVNLTFRSTGASFFEPLIDGEGSFQDDDFEGNSAHYEVELIASGTPLDAASAAQEGLVVTCLPEGSYELRSFFTAANPGAPNSTTELPSIDLTLGCRQRIVLTRGLQVDLDPVPLCSGDAELTVTGQVANGDVGGGVEGVTERVYYTLNGDSFDICTDCGPDPVFELTVMLEDCLNELTVTAEDEFGNVASVTSHVTFDETPPVVTCPAPLGLDCAPGSVVDEADPAVVDWLASVVADDDCGTVIVSDDAATSGQLPFDCDTGSATVTFTATDSCGNVASCTSTITGNQPPECDAGADVTAECDGLELSAVATDPDGDELTFSWTSTCPDVVFTPGTDVLNPMVSLDATCEQSCELTLAVDDGRGGVCTDVVGVVFRDMTPPVIDLAVLLPLTPLPPAPPLRSCEPPNSRRVEVACSATDACSRADVTAALRVTQTVVSMPGECTEHVDLVPVECGDLYELRLTPPACPDVPRSAASPVVTHPDDPLRIVTGESIVLEVTAVDDCGNAVTTSHDPASSPSPLCDQVLEDGTCCPSIAVPPLGPCSVAPCPGDAAGRTLLGAPLLSPPGSEATPPADGRRVHRKHGRRQRRLR